MHPRESAVRGRQGSKLLEDLRCFTYVAPVCKISTLYPPLCARRQKRRNKREEKRCLRQTNAAGSGCPDVLGAALDYLPGCLPKIYANLPAILIVTFATPFFMRRLYTLCCLRCVCIAVTRVDRSADSTDFLSGRTARTFGFFLRHGVI